MARTVYQHDWMRPARSTRPRDSQRQKCYDSEFAILWPLHKSKLSLGTMEAVQSFALEVQETSWWKESETVNHHRGLVKVLSRPGQAWRSDANRAAHRIRIAQKPDQLSKDIVVHELAHIMTPDTVAGHGPEWVANYLAGLKAVGLEDEAGRLAVEMWRRGVKGHGLEGLPALKRSKRRAKRPAKKKPALEQLLTFTGPENPDQEDEKMDIVAVAEIAERHEVNRSAVYYWTRQSDFPEPLAELQVGRLWDGGQVDAWVQGFRDTSRPKPGPRPK